MSKIFEELLKQAEEESKETKAEEKKETKAEEKAEHKNKYREKVAEMIVGGEADYEPNSAFDAEQLLEGAEEELEHTDNMNLAIEIAKDHLKEMPDYYERLEEMEEEAEEEKGGMKAPEDIAKEAGLNRLRRVHQSVSKGSSLHPRSSQFENKLKVSKGKWNKRMNKKTKGEKLPIGSPISPYRKSRFTPPE